MERNVMGELNVYRGSGAKPNFSEIARRHGMDRHTVAKYWREGESAADGRSARGSAFDPLEEVIRAKAQLPGMTKMAVYAFLREGRGEGLPGYGAFTAWCRARDVPFGGAGGREPHPRFETPPGRQLQFDWKEGMRLVDSEGEVFEFSVFTATLGYSRKHRFIPVRSRTLDDLLSCLLATFTRLGGVPEECITDNMSCLVTVSGRRRTRQERAWRFAREAGFELRLCAPRSPQTKGKDESANRFLNRLLAYGGEFTGWSGLAEAVARVEAQANSEPNRTTGLPPDALFMREKESLRPIVFVASKMLTKRHVAFEHFGRHVLHCFFALPSIKAASMRWLAPLNSTSLPWWTILSIMADASLSSPRTVPHFENSMFVVNIMLRLS